MSEILARKIVHFATVGAFALFVYFIDDYVPRSVYIVICLVMLVGFLLFDFYRKRNPDFNERIIGHRSKILKETERNRFLDGIWGPTNLLVLVLFFSKITIVSTVFIGAFSDPMAAIIGTAFGKHKNKVGKTWAGIIAYYSVALIGVISAQIIIGSSIPYYIIVPLAAVPALLEGNIKEHDNVIAPMAFAVLFELALLIYA